MHVDPNLPLAGIAIAIGLVAIWANPERLINRIFFTASVHVAIWIWALHLTIVGQNGFFWLHVTDAVGAAFPFHLWLVKEAMAEEGSFGKILWRGSVWFAATLCLMAVVFTPWFIPPNSSGAHRLYGPGYYFYMFGIVFSTLLLLRGTLLQARHQVGVRRAELQIFLVGGCGALVMTVGVMALKTFFRVAPWFTELRMLGVMAFYGCTVVAITTHRVFNARQLLVLAVQNILLIGIVTGEIWILDGLIKYILSPYPAIFVATGIALWSASLLHKWLDQRLQFYPEGARTRAAAFELAQSGLPVDRLIQECLGILKGWGKSDHAMLLHGNQGAWRGEQSDADDSAAIEILRGLSWATPERLSRDRSTADHRLLSRFLTGRRLGIAVVVQGPTLSVFAGVAASASRRPYTYPQVNQLLELVTIFEGAVERASLSAKAQHSEQLATVGLLGASLAHEIRNPLVSIKTFVQLLPTRHGDPVFREKFFRLMSTEVDRIDRLTEQLLELASPHAYLAQMVELHAVLKASGELIGPKAADKRVEIQWDLRAEPDQAFTDPSALKQVLLNLCFNAIQAMEVQSADRWIRISTRRTDRTVQMLVADSGPGIPLEMHARLFQPFQSTKSTGFGLGLAICRDILTGLGGDIQADPPVAGHGATFRVTFPCQPSSS